MAIQSRVSAVVGRFLRTHDSLRETLSQENLEEREVDLWRAFDCRGGSRMCTELETTHICILRRYRGTSYAFSPVDREESSVHPWRSCNRWRRWNWCRTPHPKTAFFFSTLLGQFWNRWKRKYTMDLREHQESTNEGANVIHSVATWDIVSVMEKGKSNRGTWKLGRIA